MAAFGLYTSLPLTRGRKTLPALLAMLQLLIIVNGVVAASSRNSPDAIDGSSIHHRATHHLHSHDQQTQHLQQQEQSSHHRRRLMRRNSEDGATIGSGNHERCESVRGFFEAIDVKLNGTFSTRGAICGSHCCNDVTEERLQQKSTAEFETLLHQHTERLRNDLRETVNVYATHLRELTEQSENRTFNVFYQVYRRMAPYSQKIIKSLYDEIYLQLHIFKNKRSSFSENMVSLEKEFQKFFVDLFPMAYHQAVHLHKDNYGELHGDYVNCLKHAFDDLQPFGAIPKEIKTNFVQSMHRAMSSMYALLHSEEVLQQTSELYGKHLSDQCQRHLLKMSYCPSCHGMQRHEVKTCHSYCMNVLRGCTAQYAGVLDGPWSNVVDAINNLVPMFVSSDSDIVKAIKQLDGKLSEAIMRAMENGPELEKKVKKTCGTPNLIVLDKSEEPLPKLHRNVQWSMPPDAEILRTLSQIDKSKDFFANIVNNVCQAEDKQSNDHHCWTGERIGDYTQLVMTTGIDTQRYNPEVPLESNSQTPKMNELVDKLIKIRKNIASAMPSTTRSYSDIQGDMARHDEEGSGRISDDGDDEEYGLHGSGDGSGDGATPSPYDPLSPTIISHNDLERHVNAAQSMASSLVLPIVASTLVTVFFSRRRLLRAVV